MSQQDGQTVSVNNIVSISLPEDAERLTREKLWDIAAASRNGKSEINTKAEGQFYRTKSVLIYLNSAQSYTEKDHLKKWKAGLDHMFSDSTVSDYTSSIRTVNNSEILVISYIRENTGYYRLICQNTSQTSALSGIIEFSISDKEKAEEILNEILKSMKFEK